MDGLYLGFGLKKEKTKPNQHELKKKRSKKHYRKKSVVDIKKT
jgi:hypothetical protein